MGTQRIWYQKGFKPGTIITLDQPGRSEWRILEKLNEHGHQLSKQEHDHYRSGYSVASIKLLCCDRKNPAKKAYMRIINQLPFLNTEFLDADERATQATTWIPPELIAYKKLTEQGSTNTPKLLGYKVTNQDRSGHVPGGFAICLVWEKVPGLRLGDKHGPDPFWKLDCFERDLICTSFVTGLLALMENGYLNDRTSLSNLVWHKESNTVYFIGFREGSRGKLKANLDEVKWQQMFGLTTPPPDKRRDPGWSEDTSGWGF